MSAESKKKRGESGKKNAESIPFRNGGRPCNYDTRIGRTERTGGARMLHAMIGADTLIKIGYPCGHVPTARLIRMTEEAMASA